MLAEKTHFDQVHAPIHPQGNLTHDFQCYIKSPYMGMQINNRKDNVQDDVKYGIE